MNKIDVVIVNWNTGQQLQDCVNSILKYGNELVNNVIVVDNGSVDGSELPVENLLSVKLLRAGENLGFGKGCNLGARHSNGEYVLFLNPDAALRPNTLSEAHAYMENPANEKVGICGVQLLDEADRVSTSCSRFPSLRGFIALATGLDRFFPQLGNSMREWSHDETRRVDQVMGAFFLVRRRLFEELDGFDERFFVYFEEVDFSLRAYQRGWVSVFLAHAQAFHAGGGTSRQVKAHRLFYSLRSRFLYGFKHFPSWQAWTLVAVTSLLEPFTRFTWCLLRGDFAGIKHTWAAYRMLWHSMGHIVRAEGRYNP